VTTFRDGYEWRRPNNKREPLPPDLFANAIAGAVLLTYVSSYLERTCAQKLCHRAPSTDRPRVSRARATKEMSADAAHGLGGCHERQRAGSCCAPDGSLDVPCYLRQPTKTRRREMITDDRPLFVGGEWVLAVIPYRDDADAVRIANDSRMVWAGPSSAPTPSARSTSRARCRPERSASTVRPSRSARRLAASAPAVSAPPVPVRRPRFHRCHYIMAGRGICKL
jgi:hypothetical protein